MSGARNNDPTTPLQPDSNDNANVPGQDSGHRHSGSTLVDVVGYPLGLTGATAPTRYVGGTVSGAPVAGDFEVGDFVIGQDAEVIVCTVAGSPGTWVSISGGGGSGFPFGEFTLEVTSPVYGALIKVVDSPFDPVGFVGSPSLELTVPLITAEPSGEVIAVNGLTVTGIDTTNDAYDIGVVVIVANLDGTEVITLSGTVLIAQSGPGQSGSVQSTDLTAAASEGSDLSYDDSDGQVTTTAGGTFGVMAFATGGWS